MSVNEDDHLELEPVREYKVAKIPFGRFKGTPIDQMPDYWFEWSEKRYGRGKFNYLFKYYDERQLQKKLYMLKFRWKFYDELLATQTDQSQHTYRYDLIKETRYPESITKWMLKNLRHNAPCTPEVTAFGYKPSPENLQPRNTYLVNTSDTTMTVIFNDVDMVPKMLAFVKRFRKQIQDIPVAIQHMSGLIPGAYGVA